MAECLVTTLKENVEDASLLKLGEMTFRLGNNGTDLPWFTFRTMFSANNYAAIVDGDGYFTDSTGTQNYGKEISFPGNRDVRVSSPGCKIKLYNKYIMSTLSLHGISEGIDLDDFSPCTGLVNLLLNDFSHKNTVSGKLKSLKKCSRLTSLILYNADLGGSSINDLPNLSNFINLSLAGSNVTGNLSAFTGNTTLTRLAISRTDIEGSLAGIPCQTIRFVGVGNTRVSGDLSLFAGNTTIDSLAIYGSSNVTGNISSLSQCTNLQILNVSNTAVTGDTSSLANLTKLTSFDYTNTAITGTWPLT